MEKYSPQEKPQHLSVMFEKGCKKWSDCLAMRTFFGRKCVERTYGQLHADVLKWAEYLKSQGVQAGDRVVAIASKSQNHFRFFYACWRLGAVAVPVCETLSNEETAFILGDCAPRLILAEKPLMAKAQAVANGIPVVEWGTIPLADDEEAAAPVAGDFRPPFATDEEALESNAVFIYTSGSTGQPKGVMLSHGNIYGNADSILRAYDVDCRDVVISLLPYWHAYALTIEIVCMPWRGIATAIPSSKADFMMHIGDYRPTAVLVVPRVIDVMMAAINKKIEAMPERRRNFVKRAIYNASRIFTAGKKWNGGLFRMLYHYCLYDPFVFKKFRQALGGRIRFFVSGGAPLDLDAQSFFSFCGMPILQGYGLTEAAPVVSSNRVDDYRLGSCGKVMAWLTEEQGGDYTFLDEQGGHGKGLTGQLLLKGDCVMRGYWNHRDASAKTLVTLEGEDGVWLNTGDVGHTDKDGFLFLHGRSSSMIVLYGGEKLHPEAVEDAVKDSPLISEAMVFGEKCKNAYVCVNVCKEEAEKYSAEELPRKVKAEVERTTASLASYERPRDVLILPEFCEADGTLTATMKIRRFKIQQVYAKEIEAFLVANGESIATKSELSVPSSRIVESLDEGSVIVGVDKVLK